MSDKELPKPLEELSDSFEEMFETAEAVKGEAFAKFVGFMVNAQTMVKIISMVCEESLDEGRYVLEDENHPMRKVINRILNQGIHMYAEALDLTEETMDEAVKFAEAMHNKINSAEDRMLKEDDNE